MNEQHQYINLHKRPYQVNDHLLKLMIKLYSKNLIKNKYFLEYQNMYSSNSNQKSPHKKLPKLEQELIRVEYYNDFNSCLSLSQTLSVLNSGNIESALKLASSINSAQEKSGGTSTVSAAAHKTPKKSLQRQKTHERVASDGNELKFPAPSAEREPAGYSMTVTCKPDGDFIPPQNSENHKIIKLERDTSQSFGISIVGGKVNVSENVWITGIFIKDIVPNSPADLSKQLMIGDRILAIDDIDLSTSSHQQAVNIIRKAGQSISVLVESLQDKNNKIENKQNTENNTTPTVVSPLMPSKLDKKVPPPVTPSKSPLPEIIQDNQNLNNQNKNDSAAAASDKIKDAEIAEIRATVSEKQDTGKETKDESDYSSSDDDEENNTELSGRTVTSSGKGIDRASAGNVKRSKEEMSIDKEQEDVFGYTTNKIKKKYGPLGHVFKCTIDRTSNASIGISLAGHKDRSKMACFVAGVNPKGIAAASSIKTGDEILEVNGVVLHGRCHLNASVIIKELPGNELAFVMLRRQSGENDLAVKPLKQFPLSIFDDNEDSFTNFKNVRIVKIKKGASGLGIMIIEGRHSEAGQGIFISDIQEGSSAEQAGLGIGDMILAVNSDVLLGCSYENAASLLKKSEGLISLRVSCPSKEKENKPDTETLVVPTGEKPKAPINKPKTPVPDRSLAASPLPKGERSPLKEAVVNFLTCPIVPNKDTDIEVLTNDKSLGLRLVGGADSLVPNGIVVVQVLPGSAAERDGRLKIFDQILEVNGVKLTSALTREQINKNMKTLLPKSKLGVFRAEPSELTNVAADLVKKSGKSIGIELLEMLPHGVMITDLIAGTPACVDGRLQIGDIITHINNEDIRKLKPEECTAVMRACLGSISFKAIRPAPKKR